MFKSSHIRDRTSIALIAAFSMAISCTDAGASTSQCPASSSKDVPLSGLWEIASYREIHGYKNYIVPGDYVLVSPTSIPGEACVEFTREVEGSFVYYLAIDPTGETINDSVIAHNGRELRVLIERQGTGIVVVLYARSDASAIGEGGEGDTGGGVAGGNRP